MCFIFLLCMLMTSANTSLKKKNFPLGWKCYKTIGSYISCVFIEIWSTWEVWRVLKKLELLLAMPRATLMHLSCSPNFLHASYLNEHTLMYEPIVNSNMSSVNSSIWKWMKLTAQMISFISQWILSFYFSCGFRGMNQVVSVFIHNILVNENLAYSFSWGYGEITTLICSTDKV